MKKLHVALLCISSAVILTGCGVSKTSEAIQSLNNQLTKVQSYVGATSTNEVVNVSPNTSFDANSTYNSLQTYKATAYQNMQKEESLRQDILSLNAHLKTCTQKKYRLTKNKAKSLIDISNNINKYINCLSQTKSSVKTNVKNIQKHLRTGKSMNLDQAQSSYIALNNNMNERYAYMSNIYSNLEQAYNILGCGDTCENCPSEKSIQQNSLDNALNEKSGAITKNIDTFNTTETNNNDDKNKNINTSNNQNVYPYYNGSYNYNPYGRGRFNPSRNTDTFYPKIRNIDTYRYPPNTNGTNPNYYANNGAHNQTIPPLSPQV